MKMRMNESINLKMNILHAVPITGLTLHRPLLYKLILTCWVCRLQDCKVKSSLFESNSAVEGGSAMSLDRSAVTVEASIFSQNSAQVRFEKGCQSVAPLASLSIKVKGTVGGGM
jgi:hypothetical protein